MAGLEFERVMVMGEYVFCNITELASPVGIFTVKYQEKRIPFSIKKNNFDIPVEVYDSENRNVVAMLQTETNYALIIDFSNLEIGITYKISFSCGNLKRFDSDEHTEALTTTINGYSVGIGMYNPNDDEEIEQSICYSKQRGFYTQKMIIEPPSYDETKFRGYTIKQAEDKTGYYFKVLDNTLDKITFLVAWIENKSLSANKYEDALSFWLT